MHKLVVEVRCNETTSRRANPHVPFSPEEIAADAAACREAGAASTTFTRAIRRAARPLTTPRPTRGHDLRHVRRRPARDRRRDSRAPLSSRRRCSGTSAARGCSALSSSSASSRRPSRRSSPSRAASSPPTPARCAASARSRNSSRRAFPSFGASTTAAEVCCRSSPLRSSSSGQIAIGLGDYAYPELGQPTNAGLVREVARIARGCGRELATPAEVREALAAR